jgi:branched-chain amino acid transport system substrate-binding protein
MGKRFSEWEYAMKSLSNIAAAVGMWLALCLSGAQAEDGVTKDTILLGSYGPITGPAAFIGLGGRDGASIAIEQINAAGGIHGRKLSMIFEDDAFSPAKALTAVKKLVEQDKVFMIVGLSGSNPTIGTLDYVRDNKIPSYIAIASAPQVTRPFSRYLFRGASTESARFGELYAEFLTQFLQVKRIGILSGSDENAKNEADNTERMLDKWYGVKIQGRAEFKVGDKDFTPQILTMKQLDPEIVVVIGQTPEVSVIIRQMRELGLRMPIYGGAAAVDQSIIINAGLAAEGYMGGWLTPVYLDSSHPDMLKFMEAFNKHLPNAPKGRPNLYDIMGYSEIYVIAEAMRRAGPELTREKLVDSLETIKDYRVSEIASPRTFTDWHHIGNLRQQIMVVLAQRWVPLKWEPQHESEILLNYKK